MTDEDQLTAVGFAWRSLFLCRWPYGVQQGYEEHKARLSMKGGSGACPWCSESVLRSLDERSHINAKRLFIARHCFSLLTLCDGNVMGFPR